MFIVYHLFNALFFFWATESLADQNNPDLGFLFAELLTIEDREAGDLISIEIWKRWVLVDDPEVSNLLATGIRAMLQNKLVVALSLFDTIVRKGPKVSEGWNKLATVYYFLGDNGNSILDIQRTLQLEPRHFGAMAGLVWICLEQGNYEMTEAVLEKALSVNPFLIDAQGQLKMLKKWRGKQNIRFLLNVKEKSREVVV